MSTDNSTKFCSTCALYRPLEEFDVHLGSRDGRSYTCKNCNAARFATKVCNGCGVEKPRGEFYKDKRSKRAGLAPRCKQCMRSRFNADYAGAEPAQKQVIRERNRESQFRCRYGINRAGYQRLLADQNGRCALCGEKPSGKGPKNKNLHIDHDHATGHVRGLVCNRCNWALGVFGDGPSGILIVLDYFSRAEQAYRASLAMKPQEPAGEATSPEPASPTRCQMAFDFE